MEYLKYFFLLVILGIVFIFTVPVCGIIGMCIGEVLFKNDNGAALIGLIGVFIGLPVEYFLLKKLKEID